MELITVAAVRIDPWGWQPFLYRAPRWELAAGDKVVCEDPRGHKDNKGEYYEVTGEVVALYDVFLDGEEYNFLLKVAGVDDLRRIKAEIRRKDFTYPTIEDAEQKESEQEESE